MKNVSKCNGQINKQKLLLMGKKRTKADKTTIEL